MNSIHDIVAKTHKLTAKALFKYLQNILGTMNEFERDFIKNEIIRTQEEKKIVFNDEEKQLLHVLFSKNMPQEHDIADDRFVIKLFLSIHHVLKVIKQARNPLASRLSQIEKQYIREYWQDVDKIRKVCNSLHHLLKENSKYKYAYEHIKTSINFLKKVHKNTPYRFQEEYESLIGLQKIYTNKYDEYIKNQFSKLFFYQNTLVKSFVGRKKDLQNIWASIQRGNGRYFLIIGEPGIGKSSMLAKLAYDHGFDEDFSCPNILYTSISVHQHFPSWLRKQAEFILYKHYGKRMSHQDEDFDYIKNLASTLQKENDLLLIMIDGLDEADSIDFNFLKYPPENTVFVLSMRNKPSLLESLKKELKEFRNVISKTTLSPMNESDVLNIFLQELNEHLTENEIKRIAKKINKKAHGNPNFIKLYIAHIKEKLQENRTDIETIIHTLPNNIEEIFEHYYKKQPDLLETIAMTYEDIHIDALSEILHKTRKEIFNMSRDIEDVVIEVHGNFRIYHHLFKEYIQNRCSQSQREKILEALMQYYMNEERYTVNAGMFFYYALSCVNELWKRRHIKSIREKAAYILEEIIRPKLISIHTLIPLIRSEFRPFKNPYDLYRQFLYLELKIAGNDDEEVKKWKDFFNLTIGWDSLDALVDSAFIRDKNDPIRKKFEAYIEEYPQYQPSFQFTEIKQQYLTNYITIPKLGRHAHNENGYYFYDAKDNAIYFYDEKQKRTLEVKCSLRNDFITYYYQFLPKSKTYVFYTPEKIFLYKKTSKLSFSLIRTIDLDDYIEASSIIDPGHQMSKIIDFETEYKIIEVKQNDGTYSIKIVECPAENEEIEEYQFEHAIYIIDDKLFEAPHIFELLNELAKHKQKQDYEFLICSSLPGEKELYLTTSSSSQYKDAKDRIWVRWSIDIYDPKANSFHHCDDIELRSYGEYNYVFPVSQSIIKNDIACIVSDDRDYPFYAAFFDIKKKKFFDLWYIRNEESEYIELGDLSLSYTRFDFTQIFNIEAYCYNVFHHRLNFLAYIPDIKLIIYQIANGKIFAIRKNPHNGWTFLPSEPNTHFETKKLSKIFYETKSEMVFLHFSDKTKAILLLNENYIRIEPCDMKTSETFLEAVYAEKERFFNIVRNNQKRKDIVLFFTSNSIRLYKLSRFYDLLVSPNIDPYFILHENVLILPKTTGEILIYEFTSL